MPHAVIFGQDIQEVPAYREALRGILQVAREVRAAKGIEHALTRSDFPQGFEAFSGHSITPAIEANTPFESPDFVDIWNLLDICQIFCDERLCEIGFTFWLVEELLEALLVQQCRSVFDYLELRRQNLTAVWCRTRSKEHTDKTTKGDMKAKNLIILRSCNELLKRLSRAEDTAFSGRVFLYLFQSLEFGDRSSVNLRGAFHTENVTAYDERFGIEESENAMDVDVPIAEAAETLENDQNAAPSNSTENAKPTIVTTSQTGEQSLGLTQLYPTFWSMQKFFSLPTLLFEPANLAMLKDALGATLTKFKEVQKESSSQQNSATSEEPQPSLKRKQETDGDAVDAFNPKYLTSPDLFELEISDLAFRRHILVQGLILMDFLLYQTPKSKRKIESLKGKKSVVYDFTLSDEDITWATNMRADIASYLQQGGDGKFYYRLVDTVLSRDKNWVYWKAESCPSFAREPVGAEEFLNARNGATNASTRKKIRPMPMGSLNLDFLLEQPAKDGFAQLREPERSRLPATDAYRGGILDDEMDVDMAKTEEERTAATEAKTSKTWRTLRLASRRQFRAFDKVDDGNNLDVLFQTEGTVVKDEEEKAEEAE